jgi:hypothetical protein
MRRQNQNKSEDGTVFMGLRVSADIHQRLYRAKARLELETGKFYGMGRLLDRLLKIGLEAIEKDSGQQSSAAE